MNLTVISLNNNSSKSRLKTYLKSSVLTAVRKAI